MKTPAEAVINLRDMPAETLAKVRELCAKPPGKRRAQRVPAPDEIKIWIERGFEKVAAGEGRNAVGLDVFCQLRDAGFAESEITDVVCQRWVDRAMEAAPKPGEEAYTLAEALASRASAYSRPPREPATKAVNQLRRLEDLAKDNLMLTLIRDKLDVVYARIKVKHHHEYHEMGSRFRGKLKSRYAAKYGTLPSDDTLKGFEELLQVRAEEENCPIEDVPLRAGYKGGKLHIDLCNDTYCVVEVDDQGWRILDESPIAFRRARGMQPLPEPARAGDLEDLFRVAHVPDPDDRKLCIAWLLSIYQPSGAWPILALNATAGSAKTSTATAFRTLIDPRSPALGSPPKDTRTLAIAAQNSFIVAFDNISRIPETLSDDFCRLSTGSGLEERKLFTDGDQKLFEGKRSVVLNGIENLAERADLLDRTISVTLEPISEEDRIDEATLIAIFEEKRAGILGALLDVVSSGLRNLPNVKLDRLPRMADFAKWITACEPALGWEPGTFMTIYAANRNEAAQSNIENDAFASELVAVLRNMGPCLPLTPQDLLNLVPVPVYRHTDDWKFWPTTVKAIGMRLGRLDPVLRQQGIFITKKKECEKTFYTFQLAARPVRRDPSPEDTAYRDSDAPPAAPSQFDF